jgi:hypothetical protein
LICSFYACEHAAHPLKRASITTAANKVKTETTTERAPLLNCSTGVYAAYVCGNVKYRKSISEGASDPAKVGRQYIAAAALYWQCAMMKRCK